MAMKPFSQYRRDAEVLYCWIVAGLMPVVGLLVSVIISDDMWLFM